MDKLWIYHRWWWDVGLDMVDRNPLISEEALRKSRDRYYARAKAADIKVAHFRKLVIDESEELERKVS